MLAELFVPIGWLLDRHLHERRLCELREVRVNLEVENEAQTRIRQAFREHRDMLSEKAFADALAAKNLEETVRAFKAALAKAVTVRDALIAAAKEKI